MQGSLFDLAVELDANAPAIWGDRERLFETDGATCSAMMAADALRRDDVVLVRDIEPEAADSLIAAVADQFSLRDKLELQAAFASIHGHRRNVGKYFMSVNQVADYQFISVHSEGYRNMNMQLASFYCYENTTDGGATVLLNIDDEARAWASMKDRVTRIDTSGRNLTAAEAQMLRMMHNIDATRDALQPDDEIVKELESPIENVRLFNAMVRPERVHSVILDRPVNVYWDSLSNTDIDSGQEFVRLQRRMDLIREPQAGLDVSAMDYTFKGRNWSSGVRYDELFKGAIVRKLRPRELVIQNNLTWPHAATNWTPGSGVRRMVAAFA